MSEESRTLPLEGIPLGAQLAEDVCDPDGKLLLKAGLSLTGEIIDKMCRRGIAAMAVRTVDTEKAKADDGPRREAMEQRLRYLFRHAGDTPASRDLMEQILEYRWNQKV